jgi:hypothetical protein
VNIFVLFAGDAEYTFWKNRFQQLADMKKKGRGRGYGRGWGRGRGRGRGWVRSEKRHMYSSGHYYFIPCLVSPPRLNITKMEKNKSFIFLLFFAIRHEKLPKSRKKFV